MAGLWWTLSGILGFYLLVLVVMVSVCRAAKTEE
jgi:hypothetical protein